ncbi:MAG TPA: winged helix-turn-helix domain-containing protein [Candidatus Sulfotelmatobacter sp.]|nr:winged helix-turn-helix domain-containing protein [Candidatus Sulfotelmatobacter sp.]
MQPASQQPEPLPRAVIRFGVFEADLRAGELRKGGVKIKIQDLPFRALELLLSRPNEVLSREKFRQALWPDGVFVDFDHGISSAINRLRDALGDSADNPIFVETVERRGYRWIAPTHFPAPPVATRLEVVQPEVQKPVQGSSSPQRWTWALVFLALALLLGVWNFRPLYRAAKADTRKQNIAASQISGSEHSAHDEAEQFYLKGRFYWEKRTPDGLNKALDYFTQAIVHNPNYAPAYVGLADCYNLMREYTLMPASEAYPRALAAAKKAVELDDQSSEAHASMAFALFYGMWNTPEAEREFRRAIDLNPSNAVAHHWYATYLTAVGRHSESLAEIERAQILDPASKAIVADKGALLWAAGRHDESLALLKQLETAEPDFVSPHRYLKGIYFDSGDYPSYLVEWRKEATLMKDDSTLKLVDAAEKGFTAGGRQGMLRNILVAQTRLYGLGQQSPYSLAETSSLLGNRQDALQYLKIAYEKRDESIVQLAGDPAFAKLRDDPSFKDLAAHLSPPSQK